MSQTPAPSAVGRRLHIHQKLTFLQNQYRVMHDDDGAPGALLAYAKQKRFSFREQFTLYSDEAMHVPMLHVEADRGFDVRSVLVVSDPQTAVVGRLRKKGGVSLLVSTWHLEQPGLPPVEVRERNVLVALLRRLTSFVPYLNALPIPLPWVFHFDGTAPDGTPVLSPPGGGASATGTSWTSTPRRWICALRWRSASPSTPCNGAEGGPSRLRLPGAPHRPARPQQRPQRRASH